MIATRPRIRLTRYSTRDATQVRTPAAAGKSSCGAAISQCAWTLCESLYDVPRNLQQEPKRFPHRSLIIDYANYLLFAVGRRWFLRDRGEGMTQAPSSKADLH